MKQIRLENSSDNYFSEAWKLYEDSFLIEERRLLEVQIQVMKNPNYHFDILIEDEQLLGFIFWWDLETYRYIDHFATSEKQRNKGFGKLILENFIAATDKPILLEVELPNSSIDQRRIKFYERTGFKLNQHHYEVPASSDDESPFQLLVMTYPDFVSSEDVEQFVKICHPIIFKD